MTPLELRYRRLLRLLPAWYRRAREEEMVATFLATMEPGDRDEAEWLAYCGRPGRREVLGVAGLALRLRAGGAEAPPRSLVWGEALRRVALAGLLANAAFATVGVAQLLWLAGAVPWVPVPAAIVALADRPVAGVWAVAAGVLPLLWVAAYAAVLHGRRWEARLLAGLALLPSVVGAVLATRHLAAPFPEARATLLLSAWTHLLVVALPLGALAAFHREAPPPDRRRWLRAYAVAVPLAAAAGVGFLLQTAEGRLLLDPPAVWCLALVAAALLCLGSARRHGAGAAAAWALALAIMAVPVLAWRLTTLLDYAVAGAAWAPSALLVLGVAEGTAVAATGTALAATAARALRALPLAPRC